MNPIEKQERKREARRRLGAQRRRVGELRGRVVAISLVVFALLWGVVFAQMATGNDPVLSEKANVAQVSPALSASRVATEAIETTDPVEVEPEPAESEEEVEATEAEAELEPEPEPLTTGQS
jgi:cytoskeletal protein RodZ